jgi:zinc finger MYND domain-containing protein 10
VRRYLTEEIIDQIPVLNDLKRALDELSIFNAPPATQIPRSVIVSSGAAALYDALKAEARGEWDRLAGEFIDRASSAEGAAAVRELAGVFSDQKFEELSEKPQCGKCGKPATKRCSRCKNEWYCSRACQVADWTRHKPSCDTVFDDLKTKS